MEAGSATTTTGATPALGVARRRYGEDFIKGLLLLAALLSVLTTTGIVLSLLRETITFFGDVPINDFLFGKDWSPVLKPQSFGVLPLVWGTLLATGIALAVAVPLGLGAAIYLSEYARPRVRKTLKPALEMLAGVPTIVFGYFALTFFTPEIVQALFTPDRIKIFNILSAGIIMGFMVIPTVASLAEDAMTAVPQSLREGSFGLGASKLQTSLRVVFPAALSGIVAAVVLGASRAVGETMIVLIAAGKVAELSANPGDPHYTMTSYIGDIAKGDIATGSIQYKTVFAVGFFLFFITLLLNAISILLLGVLLVDIAIDGAGKLNFDFITNYASFKADQAGLRAAALGTIWLMVVCAVFIVPVGVATAIYLEEYADREKWWNRLIEVNIQNLAAVPSIVYGILGLAFLVRGPLSLGNVVLAGGLALGLLVLPVVIIAAREAIRAVPPSIREGSMALGATQWQTIWRQVLPAAIPGVATGVILALSRALGETAPLIVVGAATFAAFDPGLNSAFTALPIQIFDWISRPSNDINDYASLAAGGILVLMVLLLGMNAVAIWLRNRFEQKW